MAEWWETLPQEQYNDWQANKLKESWQEKLNALTLDDDALSEEPGMMPDADDPTILTPGSAISGAFKSLQQKGRGALEAGSNAAGVLTAPDEASAPWWEEPAAPPAAPAPQQAPPPSGGTDALTTLQQAGLAPEKIQLLQQILSGEAPAPAQNTAIVPGAGIGSVFKRVRSRVADAAEKVGDGLDWWNKNVVDPIEGYGSSVGASAPNIYRQFNPLGGIAKDLDLPGNEFLAPGMSDRTEFENPLRGWEDSGERQREREQGYSGLEKFAGDVLYDPATWIGGYGKAAGKIPGMSAVGKGITAVERAPGKATDAALKGIRAGAGKTPILGQALKPSMRGLSNRFGEEAAGLAIDSNYGSPEWQQALDAFVGRPEFRGAMGADDVNKIIGRAGSPGPVQGDVLYNQVAERAGGDWRKAAEAGIRQSREGSKVGALQNAGDNIFEHTLGDKGLGKWTQKLATANLGTIMFPPGNVAEDVARTGLSGGSGTRMEADDALRRLSELGVHDAPGWVATERVGTAGFGAPGKARGEGGFWGGAKDVATGDWFLRKSGQFTEPIRRGFYMENVEKGIAKGLSPEDAAKAAQDALERTYPSQALESRLDRAAKSVIPFWGYESARWPYLARSFAEHPGIPAGMESYMEHSDEGYIPVGGGFEMNPMRGTVWGGVVSAQRPDFPSYFGGKSGEVDSALDVARRFGFYEGLPVQAGLVLGRAMEDQPLQIGAGLPTTWQVPMNIAQAAGSIPGVKDIPGVDDLSTLGVNLQDVLGDDRFRKYAINKALAADGIAPEEASEAQRLDAAKTTGRRQLLMTEANVLKFNPEEYKDYKEARIQAAIAAGVPEQVARAGEGNPIGAVNPQTNQPYLNAAQKRALYESHPEWERWQQVGEPLKRPEDKARNDDTRAYYAAVEQINREAEGKLRLLYQGLTQGTMTGEEFREGRDTIQTEAAAARAQSLREHPGAQAAFDPEQQKAFYQRTGREMPGETPEDAAARAFYGIKPQVGPTGLPDFEAFSQQREAALAGMDPRTKDYVQNQYRRQQYADPLVQQGEGWVDTIQAAVSQYFDIPKYRGLSAEDTALIEAAQAAVQTLMLSEGMEYNMARAIVRREQPELARGVLLMKVAGRRRNPEREKFLDAHPEVRWYLGNVAAGGMGQTMIP